MANDSDRPSGREEQIQQVIARGQRLRRTRRIRWAAATGVLMALFAALGVVALTDAPSDDNPTIGAVVDRGSTATATPGLGSPTPTQSRPSPTPSDPQMETSAAPPLSGSSFVSTSVMKDGEPRPLVADTQVRLEFFELEGADKILFSAGCNRFGADVDIAPDKLIVDTISGTLRGCQGDLAEQDSWVVNFFEADPAWGFDGERLTLAAQGIVITFAAD